MLCGCSIHIRELRTPSCATTVWCPGGQLSPANQGHVSLPFPCAMVSIEGRAAGICDVRHSLSRLSSYRINLGRDSLALISIKAGPFSFVARWEVEAAPQTCAKFESLL